MKPPVPSEHIEQAAVVAWSHVAKWRGHPLSSFLFSVPNGAYLGNDARTRAIVMGKLRQTGLQPGVPDLILPIPSTPYHGLFLEMKRRAGSQTSPEQREWHAKLSWLGYSVRVCLGADDAKEQIARYLVGTGHPLRIGYGPAPETNWSTWKGEGAR